MTRAPRWPRPPAALVSVVALALAFAIAVAVAGCGPSGASGGSGGASLAPLPAGVTSPVEGVPIDIDAEGFTSVRSFTIRTDAGTELTFAMGTIENAVQFPPNHLAEHLAGSTKIRVFFRDENGEPTAYRLEDVTP